MLSAFRNGRRLFTILRVVLRHGVLLPAQKSPALPYGRRLVAAFETLGPTFIKLGQALSTRPDLVGDDVAADLSDLQDRLPPFDWQEVKAIIEAELGRSLDLIFQRFDENSIAAASIAQVHLAVTTEGKEVAVKILRPDVEKRFAEDIALFLWLARISERFNPSLRRLRLVEVVRTLQDTVAIEMDLRFEAAAASEMAENFAGDDGIVIPEIDWQRTARRVMTSQRVQGIPIDEVEQLRAAGHDLTKLVAHAATTFFNMVFRDGFFHADLHPGNLFVGEKGELVVVDFGITGRVDRPTRRFLGEMLLGFLNADFRRVAEVHFEAGFVPPDKSVDGFTQACRSIAEPILGRPWNEISLARLLGQLFQVTDTFAMQTQPQLLLLQKSMLVVEGVGRKLAPETNMWELARPLIERWMTEHLNPVSKIRGRMGTLMTTLESLPRLVAHAERTVEALRSGDSLKAFTGGRQTGWLATWAPWIMVAILTVVLLRR